MNKNLAKGLGFLIPFLLLSMLLFGSFVSGALPPEAVEKKCKSTAGEWENGTCVCPEGISSLWNKCWEVTPKEACTQLGGRVETRTPRMVGPAGCNFKCVRGHSPSEDITQRARNEAVEYSEGGKISNSSDIAPGNKKNPIWAKIVNFFEGLF